MEPSQQPFRTSHSRPILHSFPSSNRSTLNLNSRPFVLNNRPLNTNSRFTTNNLPILSGQISQTIELQRLNLSEDVPTLVKPQVKCNYCSQDFASDVLAEHTENCDMRKILCDQCGQRVLMEIFDIHFEECDGRGPVEYIYQQTMMRTRSLDDMDDEEDGSMDNEDTGITEATFQQGGGLSYEALLRLDETVVKPGMTSEQLKEFQVQLYVKSLDGEGSCSICLYEYETGEYVRKLPCSHKHHKDCVDKWLSTNITCPNCKKYLR